MQKNQNTIEYSITEQGMFPALFLENLDVLDPVFVIDDLFLKEDMTKYLKKSEYKCGRKRYNSIDLLKTVLFGFMDEGYITLRGLEENCKVNIRYMHLMHYQTPSYKTFGNFINEILTESAEEIFNTVFQYITEKEKIDLNHVYIDGTKIEANAGKYTWVWKKSAEKSRYKLYAKITALIEQINESLACYGLKMDTRTEYAPEYLELLIKKYSDIFGIDESSFVYGKGHRKSPQQRQYEKLKEYYCKLLEYIEKINTCAGRCGYSKTDKDATFMRLKRDHMRNDQLLPAYNIQMGICDEYIAVIDVNQYCSDMDCFVPLLERFSQTYGFYPQYPVADAGYGSFNNYLYCEEKGMKKYMKFPMYEKETKDEKYRSNPYRGVNFKIENGKLICPNGKQMLFSHLQAVKNNRYGRQEEVYECEDCSNCPHAEKCKKGDGNRTTTLNRELTAIHKEVLANLESTHGALLRMNRSIQSEGTFGVIKQDRNYRRIARKGKKAVTVEILLISTGFNLYKYHNKLKKSQKQAA